ncbi:hypothetical protein ACFX13_042051 [Malus domestica]
MFRYLPFGRWDLRFGWCKSIILDKAIAYEAVVQAAVLCGNENGKLKDFTLLDVTPPSLGIESERLGTSELFMNVAISTNSTVPLMKKIKVTTTYEQFSLYMRVKVA